MASVSTHGETFLVVYHGNVLCLQKHSPEAAHPKDQAEHFPFQGPLLRYYVGDEDNEVALYNGCQVVACRCPLHCRTKGHERIEIIAAFTSLPLLP